jgi:RNA polymerase primary sigma factor
MRMQRANQNFGRTIRLPSFMHARISTIARAQEALRGYLSREPSLEEIATATGLRQEDVEFAVEKHHMRTVPEERITWGHHLTPMDLTEQTNAMRALEKENVRGEIDELLKDLNPLERQVIILRFGFDNGEPRTLQVIGDILGLPRQRVQVIQAGGMEKMRHPNRLWRAKKLTQMMNDGSLL